MEVGLPTNIRRAQSGQVACSGARRQNKALDEVSAAILGGVAAENGQNNRAELAKLGFIFWLCACCY